MPTYRRYSGMLPIAASCPVFWRRFAAARITPHHPPWTTTLRSPHPQEPSAPSNQHHSPDQLAGKEDPNFPGGNCPTKTLQRYPSNRKGKNSSTLWAQPGKSGSGTAIPEKTNTTAGTKRLIPSPEIVQNMEMFIRLVIAHPRSSAPTRSQRHAQEYPPTAF